MAVEQLDLTPTEIRAREQFLAGEKIALKESESIRAEFLRTLCVGQWRSGQHNNLLVSGGEIVGDLKLSHVRCDAAVEFRGVKLGKLWLSRATLNVLVMNDCHVQRIEAVGLETTRGVDLNGDFRCQERVRLVASTIGGDLNCDGARFGRSKTDRERGWSALIFDSARIDGNVRLGKLMPTAGSAPGASTSVGRSTVERRPLPTIKAAP